MDNETLTQQLRELYPDDYTWTFSLYKAKKGRDGYELDFSSCLMENIPQWIDLLKEALLLKPVAERSVMPYTPFLPMKETIGALEASDEQIKQQISDMILSIHDADNYAPEDFSSGMLPAMTGYVFYGTQHDDQGAVTQQVMLLRRTNPVINNDKTNLCIPHGNALCSSDKPIFKFTKTVDLVLLGGICYFFSDGCQKDFGMENRHFAICSKRMNDIAEMEIVNHYDQFEAVAMNYKNARKFADFDQDILKYIVSLPPLERGDFLDKHGIVIDEQGRMDTYDPEQCELIIDLLCCRSCHDALGRLSVGSNIIPR